MQKATESLLGSAISLGSKHQTLTSSISLKRLGCTEVSWQWGTGDGQPKNVTVDHFTQNSWRPKWPIFFQDDHGSFVLIWHHSYISYIIYNSLYPLPTTSKLVILTSPHWKYNHQPTTTSSCGRMFFSSSVIERSFGTTDGLTMTNLSFGVSKGSRNASTAATTTPQVKDLWRDGRNPKQPPGDG